LDCNLNVTLDSEVHFGGHNSEYILKIYISKSSHTREVKIYGQDSKSSVVNAPLHNWTTFF